MTPNNFQPSLDTSPAASIQCYIGNICTFPYAYSDSNSLDVHTVTFAEQEPNPTLPAYRLETRPWLTHDATDLTVTSLAANIGTHIVGLLIEDDNTVNDPDGVKSVYYTMTLDILYEPNSAPVFDAALVDQTVDNEGGTYTYTLPTVTDPEVADSHVYSFSSLPVAAFVSIVVSTLTFTVSPAATGVYTISARATDDNTNNGANGVLYVEEDFTLTVQAVNYPPDFDNLELEHSLEEEETFTYFYPDILDPDSMDTHIIVIYGQGGTDLPAFVTFD